MSDQYGPEDSATLFIPPELYERMLVTKPRAAAEVEEPVEGRSGRIARTGSGLHPVPESVTAADRPDSATLFYRGHEGRNDESTLASARDMPSGPASRAAHVQIAEPPTEDVDPSALQEGPVDPAMAMPAVAAVAADPQFTPNGTILMQAFPYVVGQPAPEAPPPPDEAAGADSARVRRALDEMSMLIDVNAMPRKLASASDDELERYVDALRRSEGLPDAATAPRTPVPPAYGNPVPVIPLPHEIAAWQASNQAYVQGGHPGAIPGHAQGHAQGHAPPPMAPHGEFALPAGFVRHDIVPVAAPIAPRSQARNTLVSPVADAKKPAKRGSAAATAMFAVMFLVTLVGVGAVTYVALRSGDAAAAVTTVRH